MGYSELLRISATLQEFSFPTKFAAEVCSRCNLQCAHCHQPSMNRAHGVMPFELWRKCADEIAATAPETECWFSFCGEPLLEPELLCEMLAYGKSVGLQHVHLNTNGLLLTPAVADQILDSGVDLVVFGVDGRRTSRFGSAAIAMSCSTTSLVSLRSDRRDRLARRSRFSS